ncbi:hypothetical protein ITP53_08820 [Nonomuraea sp. K274]|uniref:Secreted protein n=1 Tax=Nonomuraea cypriaca TaxID=1187855 RepID=A0A931EXV8_9ACTN|nr:hypothetical protein [Nonomuraea cypriaca]MBF8185842.1 hypothetical protein [Nonomuraea cypriaca]
MRKTLIVTALMAAVAVAGCGSRQGDTGVASVAAAGTAKPAASASSTTTADPEEQGRKFAACMRENGVPMEDPGPKGGGGLTKIEGVDKKKVAEALEVCRAEAPAKVADRANPQNVEQLRNLAQCMRENGVDMPDPNPDGTFANGTMGTIAREDPKTMKALQACNKSLGRGTGK